MTPVASSPVVAVPDDPVRTALADPAIQSELMAHARAVLSHRLAGHSASERLEAEKEAFQEVTARALRKRLEYDPAIGGVAAWLHGFLDRVLLQAVRTICGQPAQAPADSAAWDQLATILSPASPKPLGDRLDAASILSRLPAEHRIILELRFGEDLSHAEIATRLGIKEGTARVRLCRALAAAKDLCGVAPRKDGP